MSEQQLLDDRMYDGSRHFLLLPNNIAPFKLLIYIPFLWGAYPIAYIPSMSESWIDFSYKGYKFSINNQLGDFWFFVSDPLCPKDILNKVAVHFSKICII